MTFLLKMFHADDSITNIPDESMTDIANTITTLRDTKNWESRVRNVQIIMDDGSIMMWIPEVG